MTYGKAREMLYELKQDIVNNSDRLGPLHSQYILGMAECLLQYLERIYLLLPAECLGENR